MFPFHCVHCVENVQPPPPPLRPPAPPPPPPSKQPHTQGGGKRRFAMEKIWLWKFFVVVSIFFNLCTSICCMWRTGNAAISGFRKGRKWSEVLLQEVLFNLLCLGGRHFLMSAKFRLLFFVVSTSGCFLWFGCMGTSPPSLWVTFAEVAGAPFIPVYNAKLAINTGLVGALMVIDPGFVGQQKL